MPWCKLDATARYHFKFNRLAASLGVRRAEARGLFFGLCSWAIVHAPDGRLDGFSEAEIEQAMDWQGRPGRCLHAMTQCSLIDRHAAFWEIHGYYKNSGTFKDSEKKRKQREKSDFVPGQSGDTERGLSQDCPPREEKRREEKREKRDDAPSQIPINERPQQDARALMLGKKYLERRGRLGQKLTPQEAADMQAVVEAAGEAADAALGRFLDDSRPFYAKCGWKLSLLLKDLAEHTSDKVANTNTENPSNAARKALGEEQRKQREENERIARDPEADEKLKKIMESVGVLK